MTSVRYQNRATLTQCPPASKFLPLYHNANICKSPGAIPIGTVKCAALCGGGGILPPSQAGGTSFDDQRDPQIPELNVQTIILAMMLWTVSSLLTSRPAMAEEGDRLKTSETDGSVEDYVLAEYLPADDISTFKRLLRDVLTDQLVTTRRLREAELLQMDNPSRKRSQLDGSGEEIHKYAPLGRVQMSHVLLADVLGLLADTYDESSGCRCLGSHASVMTILRGRICSEADVQARTLCTPSGLSLNQVIIKSCVNNSVDIFFFPVGGSIMDVVSESDGCQGIELFDGHRKALQQSANGSAAALRVTNGVLSGAVGVNCYPRHQMQVHPKVMPCASTATSAAIALTDAAVARDSNSPPPVAVSPLVSSADLHIGCHSCGLKMQRAHEGRRPVEADQNDGGINLGDPFYVTPMYACFLSGEVCKHRWTCTWMSTCLSTHHLASVRVSKASSPNNSISARISAAKDSDNSPWTTAAEFCLGRVMGPSAVIELGVCGTFEKAITLGCMSRLAYAW